MKRREGLKILLLQIRDDEATMKEETESFAHFSGLLPTQIDLLNVFEKQNFPVGVINGYDAMFIGGSSDATVLDKKTYPFLGDSIALIKHCIAVSFPVFASCFGHQLTVVALGGEIFKDNADHFEMGTLPIRLTENAKNDLLFSDVPDGFLAVSVHREHAEVVPDNCELLAYTDVCIHAFKVKDKPFWTTQFHPEVDKAVLVKRLSLYSHKYTENKGHLQQVLSAAKDTPESNDLLKKFVDRVLLKKDIF